MQYPICSACVASPALCPSCSERVQSGAVSPLDVSVSRFMKGLEEKYAITGVDLVKTHDIDSFIIIVGRGKISGMIGREGRNIRLMSSEFKKKVRIIKEGDVRQMVADLVSPARITGVNVLYTSEGEKFKVVIPSSDRRKIYMDEKTLNKAVEALFKGEVIINYQ
ncbi:hypothetical protein H0N95_00880 [Candidatus Micrarchaeota archaeon]|nr:hypothetical protein [Candidatus Micrarchaeota archaeon]